MTFRITRDTVYLHERPVQWPVVEISHNEGYPDWPHVGFMVALENAWFAQVSYRKDEKDPYEGTPDAVNVVIAPCNWSHLVNQLEIREAIRSHGKLSDVVFTHQYVPSTDVQALLQEYAKKPCPPPSIMAAVKAHGFT